MNGLRQVELSASIAQNSLVEIGTDKFGQNQVLVGVLPISGGDFQYLEITSEQWGNRRVIVPGFSDPTTAGGGGVWEPPIYPEIIANSTVTVRGFQDSLGAQTESVILFFQIAGSNGGYPGPIMSHMGHLHTQILEGTATNGSFPSVGSPTDTQDILNEVQDDRWLPLMCASIGDTPGQCKFQHPQDEGYPPMSINVADGGLGKEMFQPLPATNVLNGADSLNLLAKDDSGSDVRAFLWLGRVANGMIVRSNRTPYSI